MSSSRSEYFAEHATTLEGELSTVLEMVMSSRPADPALAIAKLLTERRQAALARPEAAAIDAAIAALGEYKSAFSGQLAPPAPSAAELGAGATPCGSVQTLGGVVLQRGPYGGLWLRVGCVAEVAATLAWPAAQAVASHVLARARESGRGGGVYFAVAEGALAALEPAWLKRSGFEWYCRRPAAGGAAAELVYACWSGSGPSLIPAWATSVEGATAVALSPDEESVLLVWERGAWNTPGGAVNPGELKLDTLAREVMEELAAAVDPSFVPIYVGGWQQAHARDGAVNDNFSAFVVRLASEAFKVDNVEVAHADWFPWRDLLDDWRRAGAPTAGRNHVLTHSHASVGERNKISINMLRWLDTYEKFRRGEGAGMRTRVNDDNTKVFIGM